MGKNKDTNPTTKYEIAQLSYKMNNFKDAIKKCDEALSENPKDYLSLFLKGRCYSRQIGNDPSNCYKAQECYNQTIRLMDKAKISEIKDREIRRDVCLELANSFIELVNNNRKAYNSSFKKEPKDVNSKAWDKWCEENDILEDNFFSSLSASISAFENSIEYLIRYSDQASLNALNHFRQYILDFIEESLAYGQKEDDLKNKWYDTLVALRISRQDNTVYSEKLANPLTLDRNFNKDGKDVNKWKAETKKNLAAAFNRYCSSNGISEDAALKKYAGVDLTLEAREKQKNQQELIDESIDEIKQEKKKVRTNMISAAIAGVCLFLAFLTFKEQFYKSTILLIIAAFTAFPFIYKRMHNPALATLMRYMTPILIALLALFM